MLTTAQVALLTWLESNGTPTKPIEGVGYGNFLVCFFNLVQLEWRSVSAELLLLLYTRRASQHFAHAFTILQFSSFPSLN